MTTSRSKALVSAGSPPAAPPANASPIRLSDAALLLLGQAATRPDRMILPPPAALRARGSALQKLLQALLRAALVAEVPAGEAAQGWRQDASGRPIGLAITADGFRAIGLPAPVPRPEPRRKPMEAAAPKLDAPAPSRSELSAEPARAAPEPKRDTKQAKLVSLLSTEGGQSVPSLAAALSWQNHTVRAALTGLRQKGHDLIKLRDAEGATVYRIAGSSGTASVAAAPGA